MEKGSEELFVYVSLEIESQCEVITPLAPVDAGLLVRPLSLLQLPLFFPHTHKDNRDIPKACT